MASAAPAAGGAGAGAAATTNQEWQLASYPDPELTTDNLKLVDTDMPGELGEGQLLLRATYISVDPYMRGRMKKSEGYMKGFSPGSALSGTAVATVVKSNAKEYQPNDIVHGFFPMARFFNFPAKSVALVDPSIKVSPSAYLGVLGLTGLSAYFPCKEIAAPRKGLVDKEGNAYQEVAFVSAAAGAVGSVVGQILRIMGCRVIGSAGSDEKVKHVKEQCGFDECFNYKTQDAKAELEKFAPKGIDIYWDNVGGEMLDLALELMRPKGRIVCCGQISQYNLKPEDRYGIKNAINIVGKTLRVEGFLLHQYMHRAGEGVAALAKWLAQGKLVHHETMVEGMDKVDEALIGLFKGVNTGKMVVKV